MSSEIIAIGAFTLSVIVALGTLLEKVFGGGNKLATQFASLEARTKEDMNKLRIEMMQRIDNHGDNSQVGFESIRSNINTLNMAILEFRAKMAEDYMRRDSFYKAFDELKRDFKDRNDDIKKDVDEGFERITRQLDAMSQAIEAGRRAAQKG
jgi:DNA anti-recombination protein RmuC